MGCTGRLRGAGGWGAPKLPVALIWPDIASSSPPPSPFRFRFSTT